MKPNLRLQILLAITGFLLVFAFLLFQEQPRAVVETAVPTQTIIVSEDGICTALMPVAGGQFVEGFVGAPRFLNPLLNDNLPVDRAISDLLFDGLVRFNYQTRRFVPALAESWTVSEDGLTITFTLFPDRQWHDGEPVTAEDVAFSYGLLQDPAYTGSPAVGALWQTVTINIVDPQTIQFRLAEPYAPFLEETARGVLPQHLLEGVTAVSLPDHSFNLQPVGTGPFQLASSDDWIETGRLQLVPYPATEMLLDGLSFQFFPDYDALLTAYSDGAVDAIGSLPEPQFVETMATVDGRLVSNPTERYTTLLFNFSETGSPVLQTLELRRALAQGLDRQQIVDDALNGQAIVRDGPYLPTTWAFAPNIVTPIVNNPISTTAVLDTQGWLLPEGGAVREQDGQPLTLRLVGLAENDGVITAVSNQWRDLGVGVEATTVPSVGELRTLLDAGEFDVALVDIAPRHDPDLYDFWSQEAIVRGQNYGQWNNRRASEALENGRKIWNIDQRRTHYNTFSRIYDVELPAVTLYQHVNTLLVSEQVQNVNIGIFNTPRDRYQALPQWFENLEEQEVPCE